MLFCSSRYDFPSPRYRRVKKKVFFFLSLFLIVYYARSFLVLYFSLAPRLTDLSQSRTTLAIPRKTWYVFPGKNVGHSVADPFIISTLCSLRVFVSWQPIEISGWIEKEDLNGIRFFFFTISQWVLTTKCFSHFFRKKFKVSKFSTDVFLFFERFILIAI